MRISDWSSDVCSSDLPMIEPGSAYDYVSGCPLSTPTGAMQGSYHMLWASGETFDAQIPRFSLIAPAVTERSEEHTSELQSLMRISYAVFCLKKKNSNNTTHSY